MRNRWVRLGAVTLLSAMLAVTATTTASAQETGGAGDEVTPTGKGIVGCALLGGEAALLVEAAIGVRNGWALGLIPLVTAAGGGVGGYFLEQSGADPELSVASLVAGMALIIPTTIIVLKRASYSPEEEEGWVEAPEDTEADTAPTPQEGTTVERTGGPAPAEPPPAEEAPEPEGGGAPAPEGGGAPAPGPSGSLLHIGPGGSSLALGIPAVGVGGVYSTSELRRYGLTQRPELRVGILSVSF